MAVPVVTDLADMYRLADTGALVSLFSRLGRISRTYVLVTYHYAVDLVVFFILYTSYLQLMRKHCPKNWKMHGVLCN